MPSSLNPYPSRHPDGANSDCRQRTFPRLGANAHSVHVIGDFNDRAAQRRQPAHSATTTAIGGASSPGCATATATCSTSSAMAAKGPKRDPYARELETPFPSDCIVRKTDFPWHESGYVTPQFHDFVIYQLHVGTFFTPNLPRKAGTFLDVARKIPHLAELGVTAIQLMPIQEFQTAVQPRLQRHRLFLAGNGFRRRGRRSRAVCRASRTRCSTPRV